MKKIILILSIIILLIGCSTPVQRQAEVQDFGEVIWRSNPTTNTTNETFLCVDSDDYLWIIKVGANGSIMNVNKVKHYTVTKE